MPSPGQIFFVWDNTRMRWMTGLTSGRFQPELVLPEGDTIDFVFRWSNNGTLYTPALTPVWIFGIKDSTTPSGDFLVQVNTAAASSGVYTFTVPISSAELQTWLSTATDTSRVAIQITDTANGIATGPLLAKIEPNQNDSGTTPTSANGTLDVAAGKTVTFPLSLTFPSAAGTNGYQLTTDGAGTLTWAASGGIADGDKGDITVSASGATWTIDSGAVTLAKMANIDASGGVKVLGRSTASSGVPEILSTSGTGSVAMTDSPTFTTVVNAPTIISPTIEIPYGSTSIDWVDLTGNGVLFLQPPSGAFGSNKTITLPNATGTVALTSDITGGTLAGSFTTLAGTSSLTLGTNGGTGGSLVLLGSTSGSATISASATGALSLPNGTDLGTPLSGVMNNLTGILRGLVAQETVASYNGVTLTGTMYFADSTARTNGELTGIGTLFSSEAKVGDRIATASSGVFGSEAGPFFVKSIASNTSLTLTKAGNTAQVGSGNAVSAKIFRSILTAQSAAGSNLVTISADGTLILGTPPNSLASGAIAASGANATFNYVYLGGNRIYSSGGWTSIETYNGSANVDIGLSESGTTRVHILTVASTLAVTGSTTLTGLLTANGGITVVGGANLLTTNTDLTSYNSSNTASIGSSANAPYPGDPTKWIAINDNGTTRYIPTWN
jgi:hypothetical protein